MKHICFRLAHAHLQRLFHFLNELTFSVSYLTWYFQSFLDSGMLGGTAQCTLLVTLFIQTFFYVFVTFFRSFWTLFYIYDIDCSQPS